MPENTDPRPTPTIDEITASLEALADTTDPAAVEQLETDIRAAYEAHRNPEDGVVDMEILESLSAGLGQVRERRAELAAEAQAAQEALAALDAEVLSDAVTLTPEDAEAFDGWTDEELAAVAGLDADGFEALGALTPEPVAEDPPADPPVEPEAEPARAASARTVVIPRAPVQPQPVEVTEETPAAVLYGTDTPLDHAGVMSALHREASAQSRLRPGRDHSPGPRPVATLQASADLPRMAPGDDPQAFYNEQLDALRAHRQGVAAGTRQASGTLCAPPFVDYSILTLGSEAQPIGSLFPRGAGGTADQMKTLRFFQAIRFDEYTDETTDTTWGSAGGTHANTVGIGSATATQNALATDNASSPYPKLALKANCPTAVDCEQRAVWLEIEFDNLGAAAWPEFVAGVDRGGRVALANFMDELRLQDWYDEADTNGVILDPVDQKLGGNHNVVKNIIDIVQNDRSDNRDWDAPYVVAAPRWLDGVLVSEVLGAVAIASGQEAIDEARRRIFRDFNITFEFYLGRFGVTTAANHTDSNYPTKLPPLADGAIPSAPCQARVGIARDDAGFVRMGDTLDLGVLRTETDLKNNDWRTFYETWTRLCFRIPPIVADLQVNPSAAVAGPISSPVDLCSGTGS